MKVKWNVVMQRRFTNASTNMKRKFLQEKNNPAGRGSCISNKANLAAIVAAKTGDLSEIIEHHGFPTATIPQPCNQQTLDQLKPQSRFKLWDANAAGDSKPMSVPVVWYAAGNNTNQTARKIRNDTGNMTWKAACDCVKHLKTPFLGTKTRALHKKTSTKHSMAGMHPGIQFAYICNDQK